MAAFRLRPRQDDNQVGIDAVGDEHLAAVDDVAIALAAGNSLYVGDVRTTRWLGNAESDDFLALDRRDQPALPLRVAANVIDRWRGDRDMGADARCHPTRPAPRQLFEEEGFVDQAGIGTAVLLRILQAKQIERRETLEELPRKLLRFLPLVDMRPHLLVDEAAHGAPKFLVLRPKQVRPRHAYVCQ